MIEFYQIEDFVSAHEFWKSYAEDWEEIFLSLSDKGFTFDEARDIIESVMGLTRQEYGE